MQQRVGQKSRNRLNKFASHLPKRTLLALAVIGAFVAMTPTATAQMVVGDTTITAGTHTNDYTFTNTGPPDLLVTGDVSGTVGVSQSDPIGTLYNSGTIAGNATGIISRASMTSLINTHTGTIIGGTYPLIASAYSLFY